MTSKSSLISNRDKSIKSILSDQDRISKVKPVNSTISKNIKATPKAQDTQEKKKKLKKKASNTFAAKKRSHDLGSENVTEPEPPASLGASTESNLSNSMSHFHSISMESPFSLTSFPLSSENISSSFMQNPQSLQKLNTKVAPSSSSLIETGTVLVKTHPPPRLASQKESQDLKSSQYIIFIKPDTSIMALVNRAISKLKDIKEKHTKQTFITLKALGRAIDTATIVAIRLQQMGYFVTFKSASEKVLDEMAISSCQATSKKSKTSKDTDITLQAETKSEESLHNSSKKSQGNNKSAIDKPGKSCSAVEKIIEESKGNSTRVRNVSSISINVYVLKEEYIDMDSCRRMSTYNFSGGDNGQYPLPLGMSLNSLRKN